MKHNNGFSLMELLAVIALMIILAGLLFPIFTGMRRHVGESQCMSNLHAIWSAVRQYRLDEGHFPDRLLEEIEVPDPSDPGKTVKKIWGLYPEYLRSIRMFTCPKSEQKDSTAIDVTTVDGESLRVIPLSSYDGIQTGAGYEVHYRRNWTDDQDDPDFRRQLSQRYPREDTVITWCSFHRPAPAYGPHPKHVDIMLWLSGEVKKMPSTDVATTGWRTLPK